MKNILIILLVLATSLIAQAQDKENIDKYITAMVASDTILDGNSFEFKIVIRNLKGDFTPPVFENFDIVGGPNMSTNMQYVNGNMFREMTYTYYLRARNIGPNYIEEAYLEIADGSMETEAIPVYIMDNPEELQQDYRINSNSRSSLVFPFSKPQEDSNKPKKPKRKLKKI
jgi:hypothetical protein